MRAFNWIFINSCAWSSISQCSLAVLLLSPLTEYLRLTHVSEDHFGCALKCSSWLVAYLLLSNQETLRLPLVENSLKLFSFKFKCQSFHTTNSTCPVTLVSCPVRMMSTGAPLVTSTESSPELATSLQITTLKWPRESPSLLPEIFTRTHPLPMKLTELFKMVTTQSMERTGTVAQLKTLKRNIFLVTQVTSLRLTLKTYMENPSPSKHRSLLTVKRPKIVLKQLHRQNFAKSSLDTWKKAQHPQRLRISKTLQSSMMLSKLQQTNLV